MFLQEYISAWKQVFTFFFNTKKHEYAMNFYICYHWGNGRIRRKKEKELMDD